MENTWVTIKNDRIFCGINGNYHQGDWDSDLDSMLFAMMYRMFTWPDTSFKSIQNEFTKTIFFWNFLKKNRVFPDYKTTIKRYKKRYL
jgi:hypothetical protein